MTFEQPLLLKGATAAWPAHTRWHWDFLAGIDDELALSDADGEDAGRQSIGRFIEGLRHGGPSPSALLPSTSGSPPSTSSSAPPSPRYAAGWRFFERVPDMLRDFSEPVPAPRDLLQRIPQRLFKPLLWIFIGGDGTGTALHEDVLGTHAWLAVIHGRKRVALHPPAAWDHGFAERVAEARQTLDARAPRDGWQYVEIDRGDLLYIPSRWWHAVRNEGPTIGLTRNFATEELRPHVAGRARAQGLHTLAPWLEDAPT